MLYRQKMEKLWPKNTDNVAATDFMGIFIAHRHMAGFIYLNVFLLLRLISRSPALSLCQFL